MRPVIDLTGQRFGKLTVIRQSKSYALGVTMWLCQCDCGNTKSIRAQAIRNGSSQSCGCRISVLKDLTGQRFGKLVVLHRSVNLPPKITMWLCQCDCGTVKPIRSATLMQGTSKTCGCSKHEAKTFTHRMTETATYRSWCHLKERCDNPKCKAYPRYGGRGITYDSRWYSFENFLSDMGEKPPGRYSIDRIDNNGNYTKDNCRWATDDQQANNNDHPRLITYVGITQSITRWARQIGMSRLTLTDRLKRGWSVEKAITAPIRK